MNNLTETEILDIECKLLVGRPIKLSGGACLRAVTIGEIFDVDLSTYHKYLNILCINKEQIEDVINIKDDNISTFDYLLLNCIYEENIRKIVLSAFEFFIKENVYIGEYGFHIGSAVSERTINRDNFNLFVWALKKSNCLATDSTNILTDKRVSEYLKQVESLKADMNIKQTSNNADIEITDIISSICCRHPNMNFKDILELTMYQLIDVFKRLHKIDEYYTNLDALIHGASGDGVELKHYTNKLK